jgi:hypothetical protein
MADSKKTPTKRPSRTTLPTVRPKRGRETKPPARRRERDDDLAARLAHAEEEIGRMLVQLARAEERARRAEQIAHESPDERIFALTAERDALQAAMREAAAILVRALKAGAPRAAPPPLPEEVVDITEAAESVDSLRPPTEPASAPGDS